MKKFFKSLIVLLVAFTLFSGNVYAENDEEVLSTENTVETVENAEPVTYSITGIESEGVKWSGRRTHQNIPADSKRTYTLYAKTADKEKYAISGVEIEPADGADYTFYPSTGEISITNVRSDVSVRALVTKKTKPTNIVVDSISVSKSQNYSEDNLFVQFSINVKVTDDDGDIVPDTTVYYKDDESEVSYVQARSTNSEGIASFVYSYGIGKEEGSSSSYNSLFSLDNGFSGVVASKEINLVRQYRTDLVLYTDQIISATPNENDGEAVNIPANYELWTGEVHQAALVVGSGEWVGPTDGKFTGLSSGQHAIRAAEVFDEATSTFYFASDYDVFEVPRKRHEDSKKEEPKEEPVVDTKEETVSEDKNTSESSNTGAETIAENTITSSTPAQSTSSGASATTEQPATNSQPSPVVTLPVTQAANNQQTVARVTTATTQQDNTTATTDTNKDAKKDTKICFFDKIRLS